MVVSIFSDLRENYYSASPDRELHKGCVYIHDNAGNGGNGYDCDDNSEDGGNVGVDDPVILWDRVAPPLYSSEGQRRVT